MNTLCSIRIRGCCLQFMCLRLASGSFQTCPRVRDARRFLITRHVSLVVDKCVELRSEPLLYATVSTRSVPLSQMCLQFSHRGSNDGLWQMVFCFAPARPLGRVGSSSEPTAVLQSERSSSHTLASQAALREKVCPSFRPSVRPPARPPACVIFVCNSPQTFCHVVVKLCWNFDKK
jgi:hypothetical protein